MNSNKLSFESKRLVVDYLSFNITGCKDPELVANYSSDSFGFNWVVKETFQGKSEDLIFKITINIHWTRLIVKFSGKNGEYFYSLVQKKAIDWSIEFVLLSKVQVHWSRWPSKIIYGEFLWKGRW